MREKLIEILRAPIFVHELADPTEAVADYLLGNGVAPVVHGRWIPIEYDGYADGNPVWDLWECSECQEEHRGDEETLTPYCPNCGAKMDGGTNGKT